MTIKQITDKIAEFAPLELAETWDNVGLMLGSQSRECTGVMLALDLTPSVIEQAISEECNLIVTHHPFFFSAIKRIDTDESKGAMIAALLKNDITVYSAHTNLDECENGLCMTLAKTLGGEDIEGNGVGVLCNVKPTTLVDFAKKVAKTLGDESVKFVGDENTPISRVFCICGGGASDSAYECAKRTADVFVTGDFKHHLYVQSESDGFPIVEFSHYHSEIIVTELLQNILADLGVKIIKAKQNCPFRVVGGQNEI